ncbi:MAG: PHP domain-containing protein, partial [Chitinispirillaceae bacterium]|nr:PHP domain-containing protein [Chitinispirillaceae bacterium]
MSYVPLHTHSSFSFHAGVPTVAELVARAKQLGMTALALTDTDRMSGLVLLYLECRKAAIKPLMGVELTDPSRDKTERLVLLAKNAHGYGDLCELITQRHTDPSFSFDNSFSRPWPGLVFITHSPSLLALLAATPNRAGLYGELISTSTETRTQSARVEDTAAAHGLTCVVSDNAYFLHESDWETHRILRAIGLTSTLSRLRPGEYAPRHAFLHSGADQQRLFPRHTGAIAETARIADSCNVELPLGDWIMPRIEVPQGYTPESYLRSLAAHGLQTNYAGTAAYEQARHIQEMELAVIEKLGYASYFLIVKDVRDWAASALSGGYRRPEDVTILRGSAANAITFYNLGVSTLDPFRHDLYFQRFL